MSRPQLRRAALPFAAALALLGACAGPATPGRAADAGIPAQLPLPASAPGAVAAAEGTPALAWRDFVRDERLRQLVGLALAGNRDLRVALLNVQRAQAQLEATDANRWPTLNAGLGATRAPNTQGKQVNSFTAGVQLASWELDLFGRLQSLSDAARAQWLASEAGRRAAELALAASVVSAALAVQADDALLAAAQHTLDTRHETLRLSALRLQAGAVSALEHQAQVTLTAQARAALAQLTRQRAQDRNALALLLGQPVPAELLPPATALPEAAALLADVPVALSSQVLLRRPDVVQAEQQLAAAQANIAAARAAFWPSISLTGNAGQASSQLSGLFDGGHFVYTLAANALLTVFDAGRRQANLAGAEASRQIALAQYEKAVQAAFRDTADALAGLATWREQLAAQREQLAAARDSARLVELRYTQGAASALERLDAQRTLFAAEQAVVQVQLAELNNRVALFKALGG